MAEKYNSVDDKIRRLHNSICLYDNKPVYVQARNVYDNKGSLITLGEEEVLLNPLGEFPHIEKMADSYFTKVKYTDDRFCYRAFPLGYVNYKGHAVYVERTPSQQQTQGLTTNQLVVSEDAARSFNLSAMIRSSAMIDCILGIYPTIKEAELLLSDGGVSSIAFDRNFSLKKISSGLTFLNYQDTIVGMYSKVDSTYKIVPRRASRLVSNALNILGVNHVVENF